MTSWMIWRWKAFTQHRLPDKLSCESMAAKFYLYPKMNSNLNSEETGNGCSSTPLGGDVLKRLECIVLNGCKTDGIGRHLLSIAPAVSVVCWCTLAEDNAARAFSLGFYKAVQEMLNQERQSRSNQKPYEVARFPILEAFEAGCDSFLRDGYHFGDPDDYLHPPGHPHQYRPNFTECNLCSPPVHGECLLLRMCDNELIVKRGSDREACKMPLSGLGKSMHIIKQAFSNRQRRTSRTTSFLADRRSKRSAPIFPEIKKQAECRLWSNF